MTDADTAVNDLALCVHITSEGFCRLIYANDLQCVRVRPTFAGAAIGRWFRESVDECGKKQFNPAQNQNAFELQCGPISRHSLGSSSSSSITTTIKLAFPIVFPPDFSVFGWNWKRDFGGQYKHFYSKKLLGAGQVRCELSADLKENLKLGIEYKAQLTLHDDKKAFPRWHLELPSDLSTPMDNLGGLPKGLRQRGIVIKLQNMLTIMVALGTGRLIFARCGDQSHITVGSTISMRRSNIIDLDCYTQPLKLALNVTSENEDGEMWPVIPTAEGQDIFELRFLLTAAMLRTGTGDHVQLRVGKLFNLEGRLRDVLKPELVGQTIRVHARLCIVPEEQCPLWFLTKVLRQEDEEHPQAAAAVSLEQQDQPVPETPEHKLDETNSDTTITSTPTTPLVGNLKQESDQQQARALALFTHLDENYLHLLFYNELAERFTKKVRAPRRRCSRLLESSGGETLLVPGAWFHIVYNFTNNCNQIVSIHCAAADTASLAVRRIACPQNAQIWPTFMSGTVSEIRRAVVSADVQQTQNRQENKAEPSDQGPLEQMVRSNGLHEPNGEQQQQPDDGNQGSGNANPSAGAEQPYSLRSRAKAEAAVTTECAPSSSTQSAVSSPAKRKHSPGAESGSSFPAKRRVDSLAVRIGAELGRLGAAPLDFCEVEADPQDVQLVHIRLQGPPDTPFEGGIFRVQMRFPNNYPHRYPRLNFTTPIYHPNVDLATGLVAMDLLSWDKWTAATDIAQILLALHQLLAEPDNERAKELDISGLFETDREQFNAMATEWTVAHTMPESNEQ